MNKWQYIRKGLLSALFLAILIITVTQAGAEPQIGAQMDKFRFQSTTGDFYGTENASGKVSVLFFVGYS